MLKLGDIVSIEGEETLGEIVNLPDKITVVVRGSFGKVFHFVSVPHPNKILAFLGFKKSILKSYSIIEYRTFSKWKCKLII